MKELLQLVTFLNGIIQEKETVLSMSLIQKLKTLNDPIAEILLKIHNKEIGLDSSYIKDESEDGMVSFLPSNRESGLSEDDKWESEKRMKVKIGRLITAILQKLNIKTFSSVDVENFVNLYKSTQKDTYFKIIKGNSIKKWYLESSYDDSSPNKSKLYNSSLYKSCMRFTKCQDFLTLYTNSPNISLLCLFNRNNELMGRALLWSDVNLIEQTTSSVISFMDRIYVVDYTLEQTFKQYALQNGYWFKFKQGEGIEDKNPLTITDGKRLLNFSVKPFLLTTNIIDLNWDFEKKPYMDTFKYFGYEYEDNKINPILTSDFKFGKFDLNVKEAWIDHENGTVMPMGRYSDSMDIYHNVIPTKRVKALCKYLNITYDQLKCQIDIQGMEFFYLNNSRTVYYSLSQEEVLEAMEEGVIPIQSKASIDGFEIYEKTFK